MMLLSAHQVRHDLATGQLAMLPHPAGWITRSIGLTVRRDWGPTSAQRGFVEILRDAVRALDLTRDSTPPARRRRARETPSAIGPSAARRSG